MTSTANKLQWRAAECQNYKEFDIFRQMKWYETITRFINCAKNKTKAIYKNIQNLWNIFDALAVRNMETKKWIQTASLNLYLKLPPTCNLREWHENLPSTSQSNPTSDISYSTSEWRWYKCYYLSHRLFEIRHISYISWQTFSVCQIYTYSTHKKFRIFNFQVKSTENIKVTATVIIYHKVWCGDDLTWRGG